MFNFKQKVCILKHPAYQQIKRFISEFKDSSDFLNQYFGISQPRAKEYVRQYKLSNTPTESILKVVKYCENLGFTKNDIIQIPMLLRMKPCTLDQYYTVMTEAGFINITPFVLAKYRTWSRRTISALKLNKLIGKKTNVAENFVRQLNPRPDNFSLADYNESQILSQVHINVLTEYLKWRLGATTDEINKLITVHPSICRKSFKYLCENITFAEKLNFSHDKILKYGYILRAHPKQTQEILDTFPTIVGVSMEKAMRMYPKMVTACASNIGAVYNILKEHQISDLAISKRLNVFQLSPATVDFRLKELKRDTNMKVFLNNPNILKLVVHQNRAKSRLEFLKQLHLKCASVSLLGNDDNNFDNHIKEGKDVNTLKDTFSFLKGIFKGMDDYESALKRHPYYLQVPLTQMEETYEYLLDEKFTNTAICKVIYILLYPKEKIKDSFQKVNRYEAEYQKELTQVNKLNLALYFIEKEHHFSGEGIWTKIDSVDESVHVL